MNVYLYRHGPCEDSVDKKKDDARRLTPEGLLTVKATMPGILALVPSVDYILTSPLVRAVETAAVIAEEFRCREFVEKIPELAERGNEKKITSILNKLIGKEHIFVVGHMPHLSELAKYLAGDSMETPPEITKAGAAKIHIKGFPEQGGGMLRWIMTADELKKSGSRSPA